MTALRGNYYKIYESNSKARKDGTICKTIAKRTYIIDLFLISRIKYTIHAMKLLIPKIRSDWNANFRLTMTFPLHNQEKSCPQQN